MFSSQLPASFCSVARSNFRSPKRWADSCRAEAGMLEFPRSFLYKKAGMLGECDQTVHRTTEGTLAPTLPKPLSRERIFWESGQPLGPFPPYPGCRWPGVSELRGPPLSESHLSYRSLLPTSPSLNGPSTQAGPQIRSALTGFSATRDFPTFPFKTFPNPCLVYLLWSPRVLGRLSSSHFHPYHANLGAFTPSPGPKEPMSRF